MHGELLRYSTRLRNVVFASHSDGRRAQSKPTLVFLKFDRSLPLRLPCSREAGASTFQEDQRRFTSAKYTRTARTRCAPFSIATNFSFELLFELHPFWQGGGIDMDFGRLVITNSSIYENTALVSPHPRVRLRWKACRRDERTLVIFPLYCSRMCCEAMEVESLCIQLICIGISSKIACNRL